MPTYRSINIQLHSQFDIEALPEYIPRPQSYYESQGIIATLPSLVDDRTSTCCVYVPVLPGSQFWISYSVSPPVPDEQHFLFKLFINGALIVSWSCGKNEKWKGKTMFGLFKGEDGNGGKKRIEKRALSFTSPDHEDGEWRDVENAFDPDAYMEIRVCRAHGRKRIGRELEEYSKTPYGENVRGIDLVNAGRAGGEHPKRFYKFALIDALDHPFACFRYYYRTWDQLQYLGLLEDEYDDSDMASFEQGVPDPEKKSAISGGLRGGELEDDFTPIFLSDDGCASALRHDSTLNSATELNISSSSRSSDDNTGKRQSGLHNPPRFHRLSVPPSLRLEPPVPALRNLPSIPQKDDSSSSTSYRPHPAYPVEDWVVRTPSPVKSIRDGISTPPLDRRRGFTASSLINIVTSAWKRRGIPSSESSNETSNRSAYRDVS